MTRLSSSGFLTVADAKSSNTPCRRDRRAAAIVMLTRRPWLAALWGISPTGSRRPPASRLRLFARRLRGVEPVALPRPLTYMQDEASTVVPALLDAIGFRRGLLLGHSDGASIAAIYAGSTQDHRVRGLVLIAPHFIVEDVSIDSIAQAKTAYEQGDLKTRLARWHKHVDVAFRGWNDAGSIPVFGRGTFPTRSPTSACRCRSCRARATSTARSARSRSPNRMLLPVEVAMIADAGTRPARAGGRHARRHRGFRQPDPEAPPRGEDA